MNYVLGLHSIACAMNLWVGANTSLPYSSVNYLLALLSMIFIVLEIQRMGEDEEW